jgi:hypothetical protein
LSRESQASIATRPFAISEIAALAASPSLAVILARCVAMAQSLNTQRISAVFQARPDIIASIKQAAGIWAEALS